MLLCYAWMDENCSIPDDDKSLSILSKMGRKWKNGGDKLILSCFEKHKTLPNRLINRRLLDEREKQDNYRISQRESGLKGAKSKWGRHSEPNRVAIDSPMTKNSSSVFSLQSSSSSSKEEEKKEGIPTQSFGPHEELIRQLLKKAKAAICPSQENTQRKHIEALVARSDVGAQKLEQYLMSPDARGKTVNDWADKFKSIKKTGGMNGQSSAEPKPIKVRKLYSNESKPGMDGGGSSIGGDDTQPVDDI